MSAFSHSAQLPSTTVRKGAGRWEVSELRTVSTSQNETDCASLLGKQLMALAAF